MEQPQNIKTVPAVIIILLVLGAGYVLFAKYRTSDNQGNQPISGPSTSLGASDQPAIVMVENTPMINGTLSLPAGFPEDIPLEGGSLIESATTQYPRENARQLSVSYLSSRTMTQKYVEYRDYMKQAGYQIVEGSASSPIKSIFGTKKDANLSVAISSAGGQSLVQLSYLLK
ncbi:MAG: hypothetical protein Q8Q22_00320 [bacterium]|nr:hypothetical protein [bacterium]